MNLPILVMQYERVGCHFLAIIIAVPVVDSMCSIFYLQRGVPIAGFTKCRVFWLRIPKPSRPITELKHVKIFNNSRSKTFLIFTIFNRIKLPRSKTFLISSISDCDVHRCWFVSYGIPVTSCYVVIYIGESILKAGQKHCTHKNPLWHHMTKESYYII